MLFRYVAVANGTKSVDSYEDGLYSLEELAETEPGLEQHLTIIPSDGGMDDDALVAVWIPAWQTWEVWHN